jgi:NAD(P)H-flavin reductase
VIVRLRGGGERIPLTIADADAEKGTITLIVQEVGKTTAEMAHLMREGERFLDVLGPLGMATHLEKVGRVIAVGGGIGIAPLHPIAQGFKAAGNEVVGILGARTKDLLIMEASCSGPAPACGSTPTTAATAPRAWSPTPSARRSPSTARPTWWSPSARW